MLTQAPPLRFTRTIPAAAADVYRAFTAPQALRDWLCDAAQIDPRPGGRVYFWWNNGYYTAGTITDLARDEGLACTWQGPHEAPGTLRVALAPEGAQTVVTVTYEGGETADPATEARLAHLWEGALENLHGLVETGVDPRFARRPMFGLESGDDLNAETAARLGVPVTKGLWLGGVVEGMGAHAAGLRRDDVIVGLDDRPITDFMSLLTVLQSHKAGDVLPVAFYRGPERHEVPLELSRRKLVAVPTTAEGLAALLRDAYATADAELDAVLEGVTEAAADYRRAEGDWTIKEVLAHLIAVEVDVQTWLVGIIEDGPVEQPFHNNIPQRVQALVRSYPTLADLTTELRRWEGVVLAMVELLPPEPLRRRHQLGHLVAGHIHEGLLAHFREHIAEIAVLKEAAGAT